MIYRDPGLIASCKVIAQDATDAKALTYDGKPVDIARMLYAISGKESSFGQRRLFVKHEPAYMPGGIYFRASEPLRSAYYNYGVLACSSFGAMQLMYITAKELGFAQHPIKLQDDYQSVRMALMLIEKRFIKNRGAKTLTEVLDAYNSGSHRDNNRPQAYIDAVLGYYQEIVTL